MAVIALKPPRRWLTASAIAVLTMYAALALPFGSVLAQQQASPPPLDVTLAPEGSGAAERMDVIMRIPAPMLGAGKPLLRMPLLLAGTPTARYEASAIQATDDKGPLSLSQIDEAPGLSGTYRNYVIDRATVGDVTIRYGTPPRPVSAETRNGPLFDLRGEAGGLIGSGVYFFALPVGTGPYAIHLNWDLTRLPAGSRGISSQGEGERYWIAPAETLAYSFYATGPVQSDPADGKGDFAFYWLSKPPFDPVTLSARTKRLYEAMGRFFGDTKSSYFVFARANPYPSGGGTSLAHSFMFGYGTNGATISAGSDMLIAHEMVHTWPKIDGDHPLTAWYTEGTAEYYSVLLSLRAGTIDLQRFLALVNDKATAYYTGPFLRLSNEEAGKKFWNDARAQRVPYGRGFMYFAKLDGQIRAKFSGKQSVDDLVLEVLRRQRAGQSVGLSEWRQLVVEKLGPDAGVEFDDMTAGKIVIPPATSFGPCFKLFKTQSRPFDLGFDEMRLGVVKDLRPGSAAAQAGAREGDTIVSMTPLSEVRDKPDAEITLTVRRGEQILPVRYLPRGTTVENWQWRRVAGVPDSRCRL